MHDSAAQGFDLLRHFSVACLVSTLIATAVSVVLVGGWARAQVLEQGAQVNVELATVFANSVAHERSEEIRIARTVPPEALAQHEAVARLREHTLRHMRDTRAIKVKLYTLDGLTLFSTDPKQIGQRSKTNDGIRQAAQGTVVSVLTHRDTFDTFEGTIEDRSVLASYVPMRTPDDRGKTDAVLEIYSDVTPLLEAASHAQWRVGTMVAGVVLVLCGFLFLVVRKADRIIRRGNNERLYREHQVWHQAHHDSLTALANRSLFARDLEQRSRRDPSTPDQNLGALLYVDLDRFKMINDGFGHQAGDEVLRAAAARMTGCLRTDDKLYRIGGDEFAVLLASPCTAEEAAAVAERITREMSLPIQRQGQTFAIGATIGVVTIPGQGSNVDQLVNHANAAMRSAKRSRRGDFAFYTDDMNERSRARLALEAALTEAYAKGEFVLHYQPRVSADDRHVCSAEALLRWQRPGHGLVPPGQFIDTLEQMDLMSDVGEWVLQQACLQLRSWRDDGHCVGVSVNVSARQLGQADFADRVRGVIARTGVPADAVELELTESALIARADHARQTLSTLREQGVRIAIDDFGTGYASLTYLRQLAIDVVKLDRSFVKGVDHDAKDRALSTAIAEMARALNLTMVAEGVETETQARFLAGIHCQELQGFLFSQPRQAEHIGRLLATRRPLPQTGLLTDQSAATDTSLAPHEPA